MQIVLIAGNHRYYKRESYLPGELRGRPMCIGWKKKSLPMGFPGTENQSLGIYAITAGKFPSPLYDGIKVPKDSPMPWNILLAHGGDEKHIPMSADTFRRSGFDYIALGHIHKPQILEENYLAYPGSLEP